MDFLDNYLLVARVLRVVSYFISPSYFQYTDEHTVCEGVEGARAGGGVPEAVPVRSGEQ